MNILKSDERAHVEVHHHGNIILQISVVALIHHLLMKGEIQLNADETTEVITLTRHGQQNEFLLWKDE